MCVKWAQNGDFWGVQRGPKSVFFGPKTHPGPMNNVFERKKLLAEKFFGPPGPRTEKIFGPRPGWAPGGPKGGPDRSVGVPSQTVQHPQNDGFDYKYYVEFFCLAKVMPKTRFLASVGGSWPVLGAGWGQDPVVGLKIPQNLKMQKNS